jgi:hypothetical protein
MVASIVAVIHTVLVTVAIFQRLSPTVPGTGSDVRTTQTLFLKSLVALHTKPAVDASNLAVSGELALGASILGWAAWTFAAPF